MHGLNKFLNVLAHVNQILILVFVFPLFYTSQRGSRVAELDNCSQQLVTSCRKLIL
jgi:hypothetical protein